MRRHRETFLLAGGLAAVFCAVATVAFLCWPTHHTHSNKSVVLSSYGLFEPAEAMFGDQIVALLDVVGRPGLKPAPEVDFAPYQVAGSTQSTVSLGGGRELYRFRFTLSCLRTACQIEKGVRFFTFGRSVVRAGSQLAETDWPALPVVTRVGLTQTKAIRVNEAAGVSLRGPDHVSPWLAWAAFAAAITALVLLWLPKRFRGRGAACAPATEPERHLAVALRLAHTIAELVSVDRLRSSLEDVADELEKSGSPGPAARVRALAWSETDPTPAEVSQLVAELDGIAR